MLSMVMVMVISYARGGAAQGRTGGDFSEAPAARSRWIESKLFHIVAAEKTTSWQARINDKHQRIDAHMTPTPPRSVQQRAKIPN